MPNFKSIRSVRKWIGPGEWGKMSPFTSLNIGDVFKLYNPGEDEPIRDNRGNEIFMALSDVYREKNNIPAIDVEGLAREPEKPITTQ